LVGRDVLRVVGGDRRVAVHDQDPVGVRVGDRLDGDVVALVVVAGALDLERGHQAERLEGPAQGAAGAGCDVADVAAGGGHGHDRGRAVVGGAHALHGGVEVGAEL